MSARIDHVAEATKLIETAYSDDPAILDSIRALAHAQLAFVEQQRIANLIALAAQPGHGSYEAGMALVENRTPDSFQAEWKLRPEISEALGLS